MERPAAAALDDPKAGTRASRPAEPARSRGPLVASCSASSGRPWPPSWSGSCRGRGRPPSPPEPCRPRPCGATTRPRRLRGRRSGAMARSSVPPRGSARFGLGPATRRPGRRRQRRRPGARRGGTGGRNRASDRYPRRLGRLLPGRHPVPVRAARRQLRSPPRLRPDLRRPGPLGAQRGGSRAGTIDPLCDPTPCPSAPVHPAACLRQAAGPGKFARAMRAFLCAEHDRQPGGESPLSSLMAAKD